MKLPRLLFTALLVASLSACSQPTAAPTATATPACPEATANTQTFTSDSLHYCLLIPTGYNVVYPNPAEVVIQHAPGPQPDEEGARLYIMVEPAQGRTVEGFADQLSAGAEQFGVTRTPAQLGGQPALVLNKLPGQDVNRQVLVVQGGNYYHLTFVSFDPSQPEARAEAEALYKLVSETFSFGP